MDDITNLNKNGKIITAGIDFDFIVNSELGLIRFIRENYQDEKAFDLGILNKSDREILSLLYSRKNYNPLSVITTEENKNDIDELYKSFFDKYKKEILQRSVSDEKIYSFLCMLSEASNGIGVHAYIVVNDDIEKSMISSRFNNFKYFYKSEKLDMVSKDIYYINDYRFFTDQDLSVERKKLYMLPKQYTIDYFEENDTPLTSSNVLVLMGTRYQDEVDDDENKEEGDN